MVRQRLREKITKSAEYEMARKKHEQNKALVLEDLERVFKKNPYLVKDYSFGTTGNSARFGVNIYDFEAICKREDFITKIYTDVHGEEWCRVRMW